MKIKGEFMLRQVAGENILIPVGKTALAMNGMIMMDPVGTQIWKGIEKKLSFDEIIEAILARFEVDEKTARADAREFLDKLKESDLLED